MCPKRTSTGECRRVLRACRHRDYKGMHKPKEGILEAMKLWLLSIGTVNYENVRTPDRRRIT
jgi:hypothetical protein